MIRALSRRRAAAGLAVLVSILSLLAPAEAPAAPGDTQIRLVTVPPLPGMKFSVDGRSAISDRRGRVVLSVPTSDTFVTKFGQRRLLFTSYPRMTDTRRRPNEVARLERYYGGGRTAALTRIFKVQPRFVDLSGVPVDPALIQSITLKSITGARYTSTGAKPLFLPGTRVAPYQGELLPKDVQYSIEKVMVDGANVVNRAQQRFEPRKRQRITVRLLFFRAKFVSRDAIFGFAIGSDVRLRYPSGIVRRHKLGSDGTVVLPTLPRGQYSVKVDAPGFSFTRPVSISRPQVVDLSVISYLDIALVAFVLLAIAVGLLVLRRRHLLRLASPLRRRRTAPKRGDQPTSTGASEGDGGERVLAP
jgi:hypothetical protein